MGIPQGIILRSVPFLVYINNVANSFKNWIITCYADGTSMLTDGRWLEGALNNAAAEIYKVRKWCSTVIIINQ